MDIRPQLENFITAIVADGEITREEREFLLRQAQNDKLDQADFEIYLEAKLKDRREELERLRGGKVLCPHKCGAYIESNSARCYKCGKITFWWKRRVMSWFEHLEPVLHVVGIVGFIIALIEAAHVLQMKAEIKDLMEKAQSTYAALTSRPLGDFPANMGGIDSLVLEAKDSLSIVQDQVAYGVFSNPAQFDKFSHDLLSKLGGKKFSFKMIVNTPAKRREVFFHQFFVADSNRTNTTFFSTCRGNKEHLTHFDSTLRTFLKSSASDKEPKNFEELWAIIEGENVKFYNQIKNACGQECIIQTKADLSTFFWIADGQKIAYSFVSMGKNTRESTFLTQDRVLIEMVETIASNLSIDSTMNLLNNTPNKKRSTTK